MSRFTDPLAHVKVASPCTADWGGMIGSARVRFCSQCQLNVYNLSAMARDEAESLIMNAEGRLCIKFYRRRGGSILTQDCPVGLRRLKQRASRIRRAVVSAVLGFLAGAGGAAGVNRVQDVLVGSERNWGRTMGVMALPEKPPPSHSVEVGDDLVIRQPAARGKDQRKRLRR